MYSFTVKQEYANLKINYLSELLSKVKSLIESFVKDVKGISEVLLGTSGRYGYPVSVISFFGMQPRNFILRPKLLVFPGNTLEMQIFIPFSQKPGGEG